MKQQVDLEILHFGQGHSQYQNQNQDTGWMAIAKPSGMSVHNDPTGESDAISVLREWLVRQKISGPSQVISPVHRLDRETSGVLILAWDRQVASRLQRAFEERQIRKTYRAVVRGRVAGSEQGESRIGTWTHPLTDRSEGRKNPAGRAEERLACETHYKVLRSNDYVSELEIDLGTGRQHQIRKHASLAHHAVVNDLRYGDPKHAARIQKLFGIQRLFLHALTLELADPRSGQTLTINAPLPTEFASIFEKAQA